MNKVAIFPGSFDPPTLGHIEIIERGLSIFDKIIISFGINSKKESLFPLELRMQWFNLIFKDNPRIEVQSYEGLTVNFAKKNGASTILRGLRNITDFEYERTINHINHKMDSEIETFYLISSPETQFISSTIIREIIRWKGNLTGLVPEIINKDIINFS